MFCDIGCLAWAAGILFALHLKNQFGVHFFYGGMFGRWLCFLFHRYAILPAACVLSLTVLSDFDSDLRLYFVFFCSQNVLYNLNIS